jgi:hypothetical protein
VAGDEAPPKPRRRLSMLQAIALASMLGVSLVGRQRGREPPPEPEPPPRAPRPTLTFDGEPAGELESFTFENEGRVIATFDGPAEDARLVARAKRARKAAKRHEDERRREEGRGRGPR